LIIHTTPSAGYPFQVVQTSWTGEQMALDGDESPRLAIEGWLTEDAARQVVALGGRDLDQLRASAEQADFRPQPLGVRLSTSVKSMVRKATTGNVLGLLPGNDPQHSQEWVVYMAHHDHLGMSDPRDQKSDAIYNGAVDNASGVAALLTIARAICSLPESKRPKRSILFATVGAEEQGLLGSKYFSLHPPIPAGRLAAVINIDGINFLGPTEDVEVIGKGKSDLDRFVTRTARWQNRVVVPDQNPDQGYYYRSDQFSLAKIGVPGVYLGTGLHVIGKPPQWGRIKTREWIDTVYHQPGDEYRDDWDLRGAVDDTRLLFYVGLQTADNSDLPAWTPGDEFELPRLHALNSLSK
jgi:Zn-dependent M28 family amino/carboxypeptidase